MGSRIFAWLDQRMPLSSIRGYFSKKTVPRHRFTFWYYFGGLTLFFFILQVITGILLALYYKPTPEQAHESIRLIVNEVPYGWLIRSLHSWSANFMIACVFIHMFSVFLLKAYRKPRELMWITGVLLLSLSLGFGFTGYLLPWDTMAYFATLIGTEVPKTLPLIGDWGVSLLKGEEEVGAETLTRMYSIHIIVLPLITLITVSFHLAFNQIFGSSVPIGTKVQGLPIPFFPNFMYRDFIAWCTGFAALICLSTLFPLGLGEKADPLASAPFGIKPEWYFLPLYQSLKIAPATILSISGEFFINLLVVLGSLMWFIIPFVDRRASREQRSTPFSVLGIILILYIVVTIVLAYTTE